MSDLRPCPFCEYQQKWASRYTPEDAGFWSVQCPSCDAAGPLCDTETEAVAAWNRRPNADNADKARSTVLPTHAGALPLGD